MSRKRDGWTDRRTYRLTWLGRKRDKRTNGRTNMTGSKMWQTDGRPVKMGTDWLTNGKLFAKVGWSHTWSCMQGVRGQVRGGKVAYSAFMHVCMYLSHSHSQSLIGIALLVKTFLIRNTQGFNIQNRKGERRTKIRLGMNQNNPDTPYKAGQYVMGRSVV